MENLLFLYYLKENSIYLNMEKCQFNENNVERTDCRGDSM